MLARMSITPSVMTVSRGTGTESSSLIYTSSTSRSEQAELIAVPLRPGKVIRGQLRAPLVQPEPVAGDLEAAADGPCHRSGALHPLAPFRVVVAPAAHVADQGE